MQEIKKAHRSLAMQYHPDKNPDNQFTAARFIEIQEAWQTLSDARRRAKYDDERWLNGIDKKIHRQEIITPEWLLDVCVKLNRSLEKMDTHRISHGALTEYLLLILSDAHIGVLQKYNDEPTTAKIVSEIITASRLLEPRYIAPIIHRLDIIAAKSPTQQAITDYARLRERDAFREKILPYVILLVTLALCVAMYFYGNK